MSNRKDSRTALAALFGGAGAIGFAPIFFRLSEAGPVATAFYRLALALPVLLTWMALEKHRQPHALRPKSLREHWRLMIPGLLFAGDLGVWHASLTYTTVANATLLPNFAPVFVTLGAWLIYRQRCTRRFFAGMATGLFGATLLVGASFSISADRVFGDFLGILTAVFYAGYILSVKELRSRYGVATIMTYTALVGALILLPIASMRGEPLSIPSLRGWLVLIALALFSHVGGQGLIAFALAHLPAPFSSVSLLLQPIIAALLAWGILSEGMSPLQILGGLIILIGIYLSRSGNRSSPASD